MEKLLNHFVFESTNGMVIGKNDYIFQSRYTERQDTIDDIKKLNVIVGANNSGKSRILRKIFSQVKISNLPLVNDFLQFIEDLNNILDKSRIARRQLRKTDQLVSNIKSIKQNSFISFDANNLKSKINQAKTEIESKINESGVFTANNEPGVPAELAQLLQKHENTLLDLNQKINFHRLYIPTLRGMRPLDDDDLYYNRTAQDYFHFIDLNQDKERTIFSGFTIYSDIRKKLLGKQVDRDFIKAYETFLSENFFNNSPITLIPRQGMVREKQNDVVYITLDNNEDSERAMYALGDGLQTIFSITYPLFQWVYDFEAQDNVYLLACIEEPELYLHPSMQRNLIEVLMNQKFKNIQFFITTHSNHFLDLINDYKYEKQISIYSVENNNNSKIVKQENDLSDTVYKLLGTRPSSILLANKTIWVEGISDRIYLRHGLTLYFEKYPEKNKFSEYYDYAFIEYSGSNLDHYFNDDDDQTDLDINSLTNLKNVFLLADDDGVYTAGKTGSKFDRYEAAKKKLGKNFKTTDGVEIENYLTPEILKSIYENNKEIKKLITKDDYKNERLAYFLNKTYNIEKYITTKDKTPRFNDKKEFAKKAINEQKDWNKLSKEMQSLIESIIKFIEKK